MPTIHHGDCIQVMNAMPAESVDAIVTDPPYGLGFMGRKWDSLPPSLEWAEACMRVLKPGGHIVAFGGTRTWHRLAVAIEDAGFEMRDSLAWLYGSGFPKSMNVGKAIDKAREDSSEWRAIGKVLRANREAAGYRTRRAFAPLILDGHKNLESAAANLSNWENGLSFPTWERWESLKAILSLPDDMDAEVLRLNGRKGEWGDERPDRVVSGPGGNAVFQPSRRVEDAGTPATPEAAQWDGWGTALKPAFEPIVLARKPFPGTVAANVLEHGTGAINVDACRIEGDMSGGTWGAKQNSSIGFHGGTEGSGYRTTRNPSGRWPANVVLDEHAAAWVDEQSGTAGAHGGSRGPAKEASGGESTSISLSAKRSQTSHGDSGGASRFFYVAKAPKSERPTYTRPVLRLRDNLTPAQADHVRARLQEAGISLD